MSSREELIFISIASYRDPQLVPTVLDCIRKARIPERLRFGICWQRNQEDGPLTFHKDPRFRILDVDWRQSKGACWARAEIMKLWQGESWFLQVDSHCRFAKHWDETLLRTIAVTGSEMPILSAYPAPFTPGKNEVLNDVPLQVAFREFAADGIPQLRPQHLPKHHKTARPLRARFVAAGFLFARGRFVEEVPYDPELYFVGEETALTVRAFTHGYDLFHPSETILWHDYGRLNARKHWGDHTGNDVPLRPWNKLDEASRHKVQRLLSGEPVETFGLGTTRTLGEYEKYAGLSFRERKAQQSTLRGEEPPNPTAPENWMDQVRQWIVKLAFPRAWLPQGALDDPLLWSIVIEDSQGFDIYQKNLTPAEIQPLNGEGDDLAIVCEFSSEIAPAAWVVWPLSRSQGWLTKIQGQFLDGDYAILHEEDNEQVDTGSPL